MKKILNAILEKIYFKLNKCDLNMIKELQHHKDATVGLWAFDCNPKELIEKFNASQSDAHSLVCEDLEQLMSDWDKYCDDKNYFKSPFFQICFESKKSEGKVKSEIKPNYH